MNPALQPAAGRWTPVRQGDKELVPPLGRTVLCQVRADGQAKHFCAKLKLHGSERVWQWLEGMEPHGRVAFERVHAWAEINHGTP